MLQGNNLTRKALQPKNYLFEKNDNILRNNIQLMMSSDDDSEANKNLSPN